MAVFTCGHCGDKSHHTPFGLGLIREAKDEYGTDFIACEQALRCDACGRLTVALAVDEHIHPYMGGVGPKWDDYWNEVGVHEWAPKWVTGQEFPDVPDSIAEAASEVHRVLSINAIRSAVLLARSVIEATCKDKKVTEGSLAAKIKSMLEAGHVTPFTAKVADTIRAFGNDMAHGDFLDDLDAEDAKEVVNFMDEFLLQIYQMNARLERLEGSANLRKQAAKKQG